MAEGIISNSSSKLLGSTRGFHSLNSFDSKPEFRALFLAFGFYDTNLPAGFQEYEKHTNFGDCPAWLGRRLFSSAVRKCVPGFAGQLKVTACGEE